MGNCACEQSQVQSENSFNFPPQYVALLRNYLTQMGHLNIDKISLEIFRGEIKEFPYDFETIVFPQIKINKYQYTVKNKALQIRGPIMKNINNLKCVFFGQVKSNEKENLNQSVLEGVGLCVFQNGSFYQGEFKNNQLSGHGRYVSSDESIWEGEWLGSFFNGKGEYISKLLRLKGNWIKNASIGQVQETFPNLFVYNGDYQGLQKNGLGKILFQNQDSFEGEFQEDQINGHGTYLFHNGEKYEGTWHDSQMDGKGVYYFKDGTWFDGFYSLGHRHGKGVLYFQNGEFKKSSWLMGVEQNSKPTPQRIVSQYKEQQNQYKLKEIQTLLEEKMKTNIQLDPSVEKQ